MNKVYPNRINWENWPSDETPINETNLNKMDYALYELDDEVISLDTTKASKIEVAPLIANVEFDETTGIFTFTKKDGSTFTLDTLLEKIIVNFSFDRDTQKIILIMEDGTQEEIDLSAFIAEYEFTDSDTIAFTLLANHKIKAEVKTGSITENYLQPNYLADIKVAQAKAEAAQTAAETAQNNAENFAKDAEAHAVGRRGGVDVGEDDPTYHNNSKFYAEKSASDGEAWAKGTRGGVPVPETDETYHNSAEYWAGQAQAAAQGGVVSFNGRNGIVNPEQDDYTITQIKAAGTEGQVPTLNAQGKLEMQDPQGGSSGHTILNSDGVALTQRDNLQFVGATVTDDSTNKKTIVNMDSLNLPQIEYEVWKDLPDEEKEKDQIVLNPPSGKNEEFIHKVSYDTPRWLRFNPDNRRSLIIKENTSIRLANGNIKVFSEDTEITFDNSLSFDNGKDYFVFIDNDENITCATNAIAADNQIKIGRFHTLCVDAGTMTMIAPTEQTAAGGSYLIKSYDVVTDSDFYNFYNKTVSAISTGTYYNVATMPHPLSGFVAGDILPESVFCLSFHPECLVEDAMVYDKDTNTAIDVYLQSGRSHSTRSAYNAVHTVSRQHINHQEDMRMIGKLLLSDAEFTSASLGSNQRTSITGNSDKSTVGGHVDTANRRMISAIGCEEMCGYLYQWTREIAATLQSIGTSGEWTNYDGQGNFGQSYYKDSAVLAGGNWGSAANCGSRCRRSNGVRSDVATSLGGRGSSRVSYVVQ